jgi:DNA-binding CsgD family transcriptional regulator
VAVINVLNILSSAFALYLFIVVRRMRVRRREHLLLSLAALTLFVWNTAGYVVYNTQSMEILQVLLPASFVPMFLFFPLVFHFAYAVYRKRRLPLWLAAVVYLPALALCVLGFFAPVSLVPVVTDTGAIALEVPVGEPATAFWSIYAVSCWIASLVLSLRYYHATSLNRERRMGRILVTSFTICLIVVFSEFYLTAMVDWWTVPSQSPLLMSIWVGAMVYAIWKYGFLKISPQLLADQILDSIEDLVLLYDMKGEPVYRNRKAVSILRAPRQVAPAAADPFAEPVGRLLAASDSWSSSEPERHIRTHITPESNGHPRRLTAAVRLRPVHDHYGDPLGVVLTATIQPQLKELLRPYHLTDREAEVLEYLGAGLSIARTAAALEITERTVKAHITSIYQKTGAANRVELLNMIGDAI